MSLTSIATREKCVAAAIRLEVVTIAWMAVEAAGSVAAGLAAGSMLLLAFGADSVIELASAGVLYRRLKLEASANDTCDVDAAERAAGKIGGTLLVVLAAFVAVTSLLKLMNRGAATVSYPGIAIAAVAAFGMPVLARAKLRAADRIASNALRADAMETFTCGYMSWVLLTGLCANALIRLWWLDGAAALLLVPLLIKEGCEAYTGRCVCRVETCDNESPLPREGLHESPS